MGIRREPGTARKSNKVTTKEKAFVSALKALMDEHGVRLNEADEHGDNEEFKGTTFRFEGDKISLALSDVAKAVGGGR